VKPVFQQGQDVLLIPSQEIISSINQPSFLENLGFSTSVGSSALTVTLTQGDGSSAPTETNPVRRSFRSATEATGSYSLVSSTATATIVVPSTATLGHASGEDEPIYVYELLFSGAAEFAISTSPDFDENRVHTTTVLNTSSDDRFTLYSTTARTGVPIRRVGYLLSNQATAGTWASNMTVVSPGAFTTHRPRNVVRVHTSNGHGSTNTKIRRWTTTVDNIGSAITFADSATAGGSFTLEEDGIYAISVTESAGAASSTGISLNSTQLTTNILDITVADRCAAGRITGADLAEAVSWVGPLSAGDVLRVHDNGVADGAGPERATTTVSKVGN